MFPQFLHCILSSKASFSYAREIILTYRHRWTVTTEGGQKSYCPKGTDGRSRQRRTEIILPHGHRWTVTTEGGQKSYCPTVTDGRSQQREDRNHIAPRLQMDGHDRWRTEIMLPDGYRWTVTTEGGQKYQ